jgi:3'(2'), 5'-bisphosphate nucleotidase
MTFYGGFSWLRTTPLDLFCRKAGGIISDYRGRPLDFGLGRMLGKKFVVVAARREAHAQV